ncbi:MAG TPA: ceramidase domain-containing protein [Longimicrobiales bacterium]|nr:ceramidase domain-containing protein [Longimicrobiales bacterium]
MKSTLWSALAAGLLGTAAFMALSFAPVDWKRWQPATCMPDHCFCEAVRAGPIRQPANTASSLVFLPVAAALFATAATRRRQRPRNGSAGPLLALPVYAAIFAGATLVIGIGSMFYHASLTFRAQTTDVLGMYLIGSFLVLHNAARVWTIRERTAAALYLIGNGALLWMLVAVPEARRYVFGVLVLSAIVLEHAARSRGDIRSRPGYFRGALAMFLLGFGIWTLDITHTVCRPESLLQGHAAWHVASAASLFFIFMYYLSDAAPITGRRS